MLKISKAMSGNKEGWIKSTYQEIKQTIMDIKPDDSPTKKFGKRLGFVMFMTLMVCGAIAMLIAISFAH